MSDMPEIWFSPSRHAVYVAAGAGYDKLVDYRPVVLARPDDAQRLGVVSEKDTQLQQLRDELAEAKRAVQYYGELAARRRAESVYLRAELAEARRERDDAKSEAAGVRNIWADIRRRLSTLSGLDEEMGVQFHTEAITNLLAEARQALEETEHRAGSLAEECDRARDRLAEARQPRDCGHGEHVSQRQIDACLAEARQCGDSHPEYPDRLCDRPVCHEMPHIRHIKGGGSDAWWPICPTPCDDDCEADCHEWHQVPWRRTHEAGSCLQPTVGARQQPDDDTIKRVARELWRQDYGTVPFPGDGPVDSKRAKLYLNKARGALAAAVPVSHHNTPKGDE